MKPHMVLRLIPKFRLTPSRMEQLTQHVKTLPEPRLPWPRDWTEAASCDVIDVHGMGYAERLIYLLRELLNERNPDMVTVQLPGLDYEVVMTGGMWPCEHPEQEPTCSYGYLRYIGCLDASVLELMRQYAKADYWHKYVPPEAHVGVFEHPHGTDVLVGRTETDVYIGVCDIILRELDNITSAKKRAQILHHIGQQNWSTARELFEQYTEVFFTVETVQTQTGQDMRVAGNALKALQELREEHLGEDLGLSDLSHNA